MSMLKHVLAFFAFIVVSLAPVCADEGYIPYFPDFLEPDGIGFRGPAEIRNDICWTTSQGNQCEEKIEGVPFVKSSSHVLASPITVEFRKNYLFKKLLFSQVSVDLDQVVSNSDMRYGIMEDYGPFT